MACASCVGSVIVSCAEHCARAGGWPLIMFVEGLEKYARNQEVGSKKGSKKEANHGNPSCPRLARKARKVDGSLWVDAVCLSVSLPVVVLPLVALILKVSSST